MFDIENGLRPCAVALAVTLALGLSGCGGGSGGQPPSSTLPPPGSGSGAGDAVLTVAAGTTLKVDSGTAISKHIVLEQKSVLDNAGAIGGTADIAVEGKAASEGADATVLNHDGGSIKGTKTGVMLNAVGTVRNSSGGSIEGGNVGVGLGDGGLVSNDGAGSIIRSVGGIAIQITGDRGTVENTGGGTITGGSTAIYLQHGGSITNGSGSTIQTTGTTDGACGGAGNCAIFVASDSNTPANLGGALTLINAGTIIGNVQMIPTASNSVTLSVGSSIRGDLDIGSNHGSSLALNGDAGTVQRYSQAVTGKTTFAGDLTKDGDSTWIIDNNDLTPNTTSIRAGTLQLGDGGSKGSIGQSDVAIVHGKLVFDRSDDVSYSGSVSGSGSLMQAGNGSLILTGANTYTGGSTIHGGTLQLGSGGTTGAIVGDVTDNGSLAFNRSDGVTFNGIVSGSGALVNTGAGTLTLTGANTYTGGTTISAGTVQIGDGGTSGSIIGDVADNGTLAFDRADDMSFAGTITGTGGLTKLGNGSLTLAGSNGYTGVTRVSSGSLYVDGDQSGAIGATTVASGAILGGKGTWGGDVTVADGATLAPGGKGAAGTLTIHGDLDLSPGSTLDYVFGEANTVGGQLNDLTNVNGNLKLDGMLNVSVAAGGSFGPGIYRVFNYSGTLTDKGLALGSIPSSSVLVQTAAAHQVNLINADGMAYSFWDGDVGPKNDHAIDGGNGTWESGNSLTVNNWTDANGVVNAPFGDGSFAVFQSTPGTVTVNDGNGDINVAGMQFASDGYIVQGDTIHLVGSASDPTHSIIRVGDGSTAGAGYKVTINSVLDGDSTLVKTDAGTLVLVGTNTYTGGTTISDGTLQIGTRDVSGSITGDVMNNGSLVFNRSDDPVFYGIFSGSISGSGSLVQSGTDTLVLTGTNTYTGGTTIDSGTLRVGDYLTSGSIVGNVANNGSLEFGRQDNVSFDGIVSGSGTFLKTGDGTLTLTGANSYTGGTTVAGGTLKVVLGAALGTGTIAVGSYGVYYFSDHILQVDSGVTLSNHIVIGSFGTLDNAGKLGNTLDNAVGGPGAFATVLNHDGGTIKGKVSAVMLDDVGTVRNGSGGVIDGANLGVGLGGGGQVNNDGPDSIIRSANGFAVQISGQAGNVENTGGGTITGGSTAIYLQHGGTVTNGSGSTIETTGTASGDCAETGACSIFVASGDSTSSTMDGGMTLINAGSIIGNVQMIPTAHNSVTLSAGGSIQGNLEMGSNTSSMSLNGGAGTAQLYSHAVTGVTTLTGNLSKSGDGTWIIDNDALDGVSHTEINGGTLQVGNGSTEGSIGQGDVQVYSNAKLVFDRSDEVIFAGLISGPLVQTGTGKLILNDVSFPDITIQRGTLQIGDGGSIHGGNGNVTNNGSLIFDHSNQVAFYGTISGTGSLTKQGTGTLTLYAANTYIGSTTINEGTLRSVNTLLGNVVVNAGAVLDGASHDGVPPGVFQVTGNLSNAGTVAVHGRDSTVVGNYVQSSTGTLAISLGSKLAVHNTATLNGGTLEVTGADSGYVSNTHTNVLTAGGGVTGTFAQLVKGTGVVFTATTINYGANSVWLDTTGLNVTTAAAGNGVSYTPASMGSARRVQGAFEQLNTRIAAGNLAGVSDDFVQSAGRFQQSPTLQAAQASLQSLSGQLHAASAAMTFQAIDASSRALSDRFDHLLDNGVGFGMWTHNLSVGGDMARAGYNGVGFQLNGWLVGSDRQIGRSGVAGYAFGQSQGLQRLNQSYDHNNSRSTEGMVYAGWLNGNWYTHGHVGFGHSQQNVRRQILLGDSTHGLVTQYNGSYEVAYGESGLHFNRGHSHVTPFVSVQYARIGRDGFAEQGAGGFGLRSNAQTLDRWQAGLGVRAGQHWNLDGGRAVDFSARAQWQRTLASRGDVFNASFVGLQQWQPLVGIGLSRYSGLIGLALDSTLSANTSLKFSYDYEMGQHDHAQALSARLNVAF